MFVAGQSQSVHRAVLPLGVSVRVRAGRVRGNVGGAYDDRPPLLLLGARSPLLSALDVLDSLKLDRERWNIFMQLCFLGKLKVLKILNHQKMKSLITVQEKHKYVVHRAERTPPEDAARAETLLPLVSHTPIRQMGVKRPYWPSILAHTKREKHYYYINLCPEDACSTVAKEGWDYRSQRATPMRPC